MLDGIWMQKTENETWLTLLTTPVWYEWLSVCADLFQDNKIILQVVSLVDLVLVSGTETGHETDTTELVI